jgi:PAS domain S-box-containing protein
MNLDDLLVQIQQDKQSLFPLPPPTDSSPTLQLTDAIAITNTTRSLTEEQKLEIVAAAFGELSSIVAELQAVNVELRASNEELSAELTQARLTASPQQETQRKQAEANLLASEARYRAIVQDQTELICRFTPDGILTFVNNAVCRYAGVESEILIGQQLMEFVADEDQEALSNHLRSLNREHPVGTLERRSVLPNGEVRWQQWIDRAIFNQADELVEFQCVGRDITDRKQAEEQLRYRLEIETAVAQVSRQLATNEQADFHQILELLGVRVGGSRAYLTQFQAGGTRADLLYEWCDCQTEPNIEHFQNVDMSPFTWWMEKLNRNENVVISNVEALPLAAQAEKIRLKSVGVCSILSVPIHTEWGYLWGTISFERSGENCKNWSDEDAQLLRVVGEMIYNYFARRQAQEELRASEALYASIFNHSADGICLINVLPDGQFAYETLNPIHEEKTGIKASELAGKTPPEALTPEVAAHVEERYRAAIAKGEPITYEETLSLPGGTLVWQTKLVPIRDATGRIVKLQGSSRDITEEKQSLAEQLRQAQYQQLLASITLKIRESLQIEEILQTTVTELQKMLECDRVIFFRLEADSSGKVFNEAVVSGFPTMLGQLILDENCQDQYLQHYSQGHISACADVELAELTPCQRELLQHYQIRASLVVPILVTVEWREGEPFACLSSQSPMPNPKSKIRPPEEAGGRQNQLWGLLCVHQCSEPREWTHFEIDLLQQLANQLSIALYQAELLELEIRYSQELACSNAELEQFAYVASHDLKAPLSSISAYAQLLERRYKDQLDAKANRFIDHIINQTKRMDTLINDLLEYSRVGRRHKPFEPIDCNRVVEEAIAILQIVIRKSKAVVTYSDLPVVIADRHQLVQLFQNLIGNAIKYCQGRSPLVHVNASLREDECLFSVRDNGIGIDSKFSERIFQIFQRLHTEEEYSGTGIGLAICKKIVESHGGRIWVESQLTQGSTFYFTLPHH